MLRDHRQPGLRVPEVLSPPGTSRRAQSSDRSRSRGQSLAEFALIAPVLFLLLGGVIQFGIVFWAQNTLTQVVRDTGRWAASQQSCTATDPIIAKANTIAAASSLIGYSTWPAGNVTVSWTGAPCPPTSNQQTSFVTVTIHHQVPVFFPLVPGGGTISSSAQFRMEPVTGS